MELFVKSLAGSYLVSGLEDGTTIADLKHLLHQQHSQAPEPEEQCLVYRNAVLASADAALQHLGITHGDQLVLLAARPAVKRPRAQTTPAADTAAIRAAITEEARSRGIEHTLKEERPPVARRGMRLPAELLGASLGASNEQLLQLLQQAFDGRLPGLQLNVSSTGQDTQADAAEQEEEEEGELQVPEPPADRISQLTDMGFSEALSRNALLLHRSNVEAALEWLLEHADDPAAAQPLPQERLRQIYGRRRGRGAGRPSLAGLRPEVLLSQLTDMGFDANAAQSVLSRVGPSLELAVQLLLGGSGGGALPAARGSSDETSTSPAAAGSAGGDSSGGGAAAEGSQDGSSMQSPQGAASGSEASGSRSASRQGAAPAAQEGAGGTSGEAAAAAAGGVTDDDAVGDEDEDDEFEDGDEDEFEDEDEDEYYDGDDDEDALYDLPIGGTVQLANLGSADIEQLLQGASLQELTMGNQLLMPGGMDTGLAGPQSTLLRLLDSPAFLEQVAAGMQALQSGDEQQQQQPQQQQQEQQAPNQHDQQQPAPDTSGGGST